jgi:hypothetical protein
MESIFDDQEPPKFFFINFDLDRFVHTCFAEGFRTTNPLPDEAWDWNFGINTLRQIKHIALNYTAYSCALLKRLSQVGCI